MNPKTVHIVTVFPYPFGGGIMSHIELLMKGLEEQGVTCLLTSSSDINRFVKLFFIKLPSKIVSLYSHDLAVIMLNELTSFFLAVKIWFSVIKNPNQIINPQSVYCTPWIFRFLSSQKIEIVLTVHGYATFEPISQGYVNENSRAAQYYQKIERRSYDRVNRIITVDHRIHDHIISFGISSSKIFEIKNFLNPYSFKTNPDVYRRKEILEKELGIKEQDPLICLCPRRWVPKNGVEYAIMAWKYVVSDALIDKPIFLVLIGFGQDEEKLKKLTEELDLGKTVVFKGKVNHESMPDYYSYSDVVIIPSIHIANVEEATSIAALEAMSAGKATIVTNVGGLKELVVDEDNGLIVPDKDPKSLGDAIKKVLLNPDLKEMLGERARNYIIENHDYRQATKKFLKIYFYNEE